MTIKVTASTFSFNELFQEKKMDIARYIEKCAEFGFSGIELNDGYLNKDKSISAKEIKKRAITLGLSIVAVAIESVFVRNNEREIEKEKQNIIDWLEKAYFFGAPILRLNTGQMVNTLKTLRNQKVTWDTIKDWTARTFQEVIPYAEKLGVMFAMENHYCATRTSDETIELIRKVDSPWFKINIDTGNFYEDIHYGNDFNQNPEILERAKPFEDVYEGIEKMAADMIYCHAKIYKLDADGCNDLLLDYDRIFKIFARHGYRGYISIENFSHEDPLKIIPRAASMLKNKWDKLGNMGMHFTTPDSTCSVR
jgi:sugar phosphate isomerase/epimerase